MKELQGIDGRISIRTVRQVMLAAQGLDRSSSRPAVKADVLEAVRRMSLLQIDTIHFVRRSPYLVLWSRLDDYPPEWLGELLAEGALFDFDYTIECYTPAAKRRYGYFTLPILHRGWLIGRKGFSRSRRCPWSRASRLARSWSTTWPPPCVAWQPGTPRRSSSFASPIRPSWQEGWKPWVGGSV